MTGKVKLADLVGMPPDDCLERAASIVERARPLFAGEHPAVQGAALAELLALWLAGHQVGRETHEELIERHVDAVRELLPICAAEIAARLKQEGIAV